MTPKILALTALSSLVWMSQSEARDVVIPPDVAVIDCSTVNPGDKLILPKGNRGPLKLNNCRGLIDAPITLISDPNERGQTIIESNHDTAGGHVFQCRNCEHFVIDGGTLVNDLYGIKITMVGGKSPSYFVRFAGVTRFVTVRGIEVDGRWPQLADNGIGILINDRAITRDTNPGEWHEGIILERNYIHNTEGEGMYIGPNWFNNGLPLRDIRIENNRVEQTGFEGINLKSAIAGRNLIKKNKLLNVGMKPDTSHQQAGIALYESQGEIEQNIVFNSGAQGIFHFIHWMPIEYGPMKSVIQNNLVFGAGRLQQVRGVGIKSHNQPGYALPSAVVRNNTIIDSAAEAIELGERVANGIVENNLVANAGTTPFVYPTSTKASSNLVVAKNGENFTNISNNDYSLALGSPAIDAANRSFPAIDIVGNERPYGSAADIGAFEYTSKVNPRPLAPFDLIVR